MCMTPIIGIQIVGSSLFQSLGKALHALILTLSRQVLLLIPLVLILPHFFTNKLMGVWIAFPISDLVTTLITFVLLKSEMNKLG